MKLNIYICSLLFIICCTISCTKTDKLVNANLNESFQLKLNHYEPVAFACLNNTLTGELIDYIDYSTEFDTILDIPDGMTTDNYTVTLFYDRAGTYFNEKVTTVSYQDVEPADIVVEPLVHPNGSLGYNKFFLAADSKIERFLNQGSNHLFFQRFAADSLSIHMEVQKDAGLSKIIQVKLKDEAFSRYLFIEDSTAPLSDTIQIESLPIITETINIAYDDNIKSGRVFIYGKSQTATDYAMIYDSYKLLTRTNRDVDFPYIPGLFEYKVRIFYSTDAGRSGFIVSDEIPNIIKELDGSPVNNNLTLQDFDQNISEGDFILNGFSTRDYTWYIHQDISKNNPFVKPELPQAVLDSYPFFSEDATLFSSSIYTINSANQFPYQDLVLGGDRNLLNPPYFGFDFNVRDQYFLYERNDILW